MSVTLKKLPNCEVELTITIDEADLVKYREQAAKMLSDKVSIKGFRQGKAPVDLIAQTVGEPHFLQAIPDLAIPQTYFNAIKKAEIEALSRPSVTIVTSNPLVYTARIATLPQVKLKNIDQLKIKQRKVVVEKAEIDGTIQELLKYKAKYTDVDRPAAKNDRVEIDFAGFSENGVALDQTASKNHPLIIGEGRFVPGFEDNLIGMNKGESKRFPIKFPADYDHDDFRNQTVEFAVTMNRIEATELPEIDAEFTQSILGSAKTAVEFREIISEDILRQKRSRELERQQAELFDELIKHAELEYSPLLIEQELDYLEDQQAHELSHRGIKWDEFKTMLKEQGRDWRAEKEPEAKQRVETRHAIRQLITDANIVASEEAIKAVLQSQSTDLKKVKPGSKAYQQAKEKVLLDQIFNQFIELDAS